MSYSRGYSCEAARAKTRSGKFIVVIVRGSASSDIYRINCCSFTSFAAQLIPKRWFEENATDKEKGYRALLAPLIIACMPACKPKYR
jgi:hypothetical protein